MEALIKYKTHPQFSKTPPSLPLSGEGFDSLPDKGGLGWVLSDRKGFLLDMKKLYIPYNRKLVEIARENRKNPTQAEKKLWSEVLRSKQFEKYKFLRQKPLDNFIADFYCAKLMLVIEIDGDSHATQEEYDILRSEKLDAYGIKVIRYTNEDIISNIEGVYKDLKERIEKI